MKNTFSKLALTTIGLASLPVVVLAGSAESLGLLELATIAGHYLSSIGFLVATIIMAVAVSKYGGSALGAALSYFIIGTGVFFLGTVFQGLGGEFFEIGDMSMDVWWHFIFYLALASYYLGIKALVKMGSGDPTEAAPSSFVKGWALFSTIVLVVIFFVPKMFDSGVVVYGSSTIGQFGFHHLIGFVIAFLVGAKMIFAKKNLGQIGRAIANPMIIAVWVLSARNFWELSVGSWKLVDVAKEFGEGGEKIFLVITAVCVISAARQLKSFTKV